VNNRLFVHNYTESQYCLAWVVANNVVRTGERLSQWMKLMMAKNMSRSLVVELVQQSRCCIGHNRRRSMPGDGLPNRLAFGCGLGVGVVAAARPARGICRNWSVLIKREHERRKWEREFASRQNDDKTADM
jgi:hypothetical protein